MNTIPVLSFGSGAMSCGYDLLWTYSNASADYNDAVTARFDVSGYSMLLVELMVRTSYMYDSGTVYMTSRTLYENIIINDQALSYEHIVGGCNSVDNMYRYATVTNEGIVFTESTITRINDPTTNQTTSLYPYRIYGIR